MSLLWVRIMLAKYSICWPRGTAGGKPRPSTPSETRRGYKEFHPVPGPHRLIHQRQESNPVSPVYIGPGKRPYHWANP
ncbi:unnamed protein product [Prunus armeniaca]|uniref:Secreted protein n=1 Tax=Prunus armeniaca TaxID=36596 RepID=A0A6J5WU50_PRUAR|nr:unnamed protein product [Prunus armeniaca]